MPSILVLGSTNDSILVHRQTILDELNNYFPGNISLSESRYGDQHGLYWHLPKRYNSLEKKTIRDSLILLRNSISIFKLDAIYLDNLLDPSIDSLFVFDMDSTLIQEEVIDELARINGAYEIVAQVTRKAMEGGLGFDEALRKRVVHLAGLPETVFADLYPRLTVNSGVKNALSSLKNEHKAKVAVLSGGFSPILDIFEKEYGLDYTEANQLEIKNCQLTGALKGQIVGKEHKRDVLVQLCNRWSIPKSQVVAIGDGANDSLMLQEAGLGIGFHAKEGLKDKILNWIDYNSMESILLLFAPSL